MKSPSFLYLALTSLTFVAAAPVPQGYSAGSSATVNLGYATYDGVTLDAGVNEFLGMRYAAPPLGNLRWRAPQDPTQESSPQPASAFGPICVGASQDVSSTLSEDCLYINVFAPSNATSDSKLPVWFYIQGGGYASNANANYNGTDVVVNSGYDLVLVNFNYRVGALGFLASEEVRRDGDLNVGLLDQRKALKWVQQYIHLFGGDPNHVVIHGASAGGGSVSFHLTAYNGRDDGLFVGAIPESPFFPTHRRVEQMEFQYKRFLADTACNGTPDPLSCLRSADISTIQAANVPSKFPGAENDPVPEWYFLPVIDGTFSVDYQYAQYETGRFVKVPVMVAGDTNEGTDFAYNASTPEQVAAFVQSDYPHLNNQQLQEINDAYPLTAPLPKHAAYFPSAAAAYGDVTFTCGGILISKCVSQYVSPQESWNYRYNVQDPADIAAGLGVPHTAETPAIFGVGYAGGTGTSLQTTNAAIVPVVQDYYISFVTTLNPNTRRDPSSPYWNTFGFGNGERLRIQTNDTAMEVIDQTMEDRCRLWWSLYPVLQQ